MSHARWAHASARVWQDPAARLQAVLLGIVASAYVFHLVPDSTLRWYSERWFCVPFLAVPTLASVLAWRRAAGTTEVYFWRMLALALFSWLGALLCYGFVPEGMWTPAWDAFVNGLYLSYYVPALILFDLADAGHDEDPLHVAERRLRALGIIVFVLGWAAYGLVVPALLTGAVAKRQVVGSVLFVIFDIILVSRGIDAYRHATSERWRRIFGALCAAVAFLLLTDIFNVLIARALVSWRIPGPVDFWWAMPGLAITVAIAMGAEPADLSGAERAQGADPSLRPIRVGVQLVLAGMSFPLGHTLLTWLDVIDESDTQLFTTQLATAMGSLAALALLAIAAYRRLEQQRTRTLLEQRRLESQLLQAQKMEAVGRLAGGVAHDFNNLLTAISGYADLVVDNLSADDENRPALQEIQAAAKRASALTRQLLTFSRRQVVQPQVVNVNSLIVNIERMTSRLIGENIQLDTRLAEAAGSISIDPNQFEQVLVNLAVNARDAMPQGGRLTIASHARPLDARGAAEFGLEPGRYTEIIVRDTGAGIPPEVLPHLFEPFFTTKGRDKGTGLGLATVWGIVSAAKGRVTVSSTLNTGTEFRVLLPQVEAAGLLPAPLPPAPDQPDSPGGQATILLAEDEPAVLTLVRNILHSHGYTVLTAASGEAALDVALGHPGPIDLLLTDLVMPGINGRVLAERFLEQRPGVRVLFMTGYTDDDVVQHGLAAGRVDLLQKPFTAEALCARVRASLEHAG